MLELSRAAEFPFKTRLKPLNRIEYYRDGAKARLHLKSIHRRTLSALALFLHLGTFPNYAK